MKTSLPGSSSCFAWIYYPSALAGVLLCAGCCCLFRKRKRPIRPRERQTTRALELKTGDARRDMSVSRSVDLRTSIDTLNTMGRMKEEKLQINDAPDSADPVPSAPDASDADEPNLCIVCAGEKIDHVILPCGHMVLCSTCSQEILRLGSTCPICRQPITAINRVFGPTI